MTTNHPTKRKLTIPSQRSRWQISTVFAERCGALASFWERWSVPLSASWVGGYRNPLQGSVGINGNKLTCREQLLGRPVTQLRGANKLLIHCGTPLTAVASITVVNARFPVGLGLISTIWRVRPLSQASSTKSAAGYTVPDVPIAAKRSAF